MHGKAFFLNDASVGWHVWPHGCREAKSLCCTRHKPISVLWKKLTKKKQRVPNTTRSFTVNIIVFATSSGNVARNHFISVCEGVPFLRNPMVFFRKPENIVTCDRYRFWNKCLWKKILLYTYMCLIGATWGCRHVELCEFAQKNCAVICDTFSFRCTKWRCHAGAISANDVRMPEHRPYMQFEGGWTSAPPPHLVLCEASTLCNGVITCECRSTDHVCKHRPFATMRMICVWRGMEHMCKCKN